MSYNWVSTTDRSRISLLFQETATCSKSHATRRYEQRNTSTQLRTATQQREMLSIYLKWGASGLYPCSNNDHTTSLSLFSQSKTFIYGLNCVYSYEMLFKYPHHRISILNARYLCDLNLNKRRGCLALILTTLGDGRDWSDASSLTEISCEHEFSEDNALLVISFILMQFSKLWHYYSVIND